MDSRERISTCLAAALGAAGVDVEPAAVARTIGLPLGDVVDLFAPDLVDVVVGGRFGAAKGEVLREIGATAYVGDHPGDVLAALTAGVDGLAVLTGGATEDELRAAGATHVVADLDAFGPWLAGHLERTSGGRPAPADHRA